MAKPGQHRATTTRCWSFRSAGPKARRRRPVSRQRVRGCTSRPKRKRASRSATSRFGGVSPINAHMRALIKALQHESTRTGPRCRSTGATAIGTRSSPDTWRRWRRRRQPRDRFRHEHVQLLQRLPPYREDSTRPRAGPKAPRFDKLRVPYNHPGFIEAMTDRVSEAFEKCPRWSAATRRPLPAHSLPPSMARGARYEAQLEASCRLVGDASSIRAGDRLPEQQRIVRPGDLARPGHR